jgi:hypothetical protein
LTEITKAACLASLNCNVQPFFSETETVTEGEVVVSKERSLEKNGCKKILNFKNILKLRLKQTIW